MPRIWTVLLLVIGAIASSPSFAQSHRCNLNRIRAELGSSEQFPSLIGCKPSDVSPILKDQDYGLTIESRVASETIRAGRIVSQRVQSESSNVYVDISTGPPPRQREESDGQTSNILGQIFGRVIEEVVNSPRNRQPPQPEPYREPAPPAPNPAPNSDLKRVMAPPPVVQPAPPPPVVQQPPPPVVQPPPPPAPADTQSGRKAEEKVAQASIPPQSVDKGAQSQPAPVSVPQVTAPPPVLTTAPQPIATDAITPTNPPPPPPPPVSRFFIQGNSSAREGGELLLSIRREGRDAFDHRIELSYSDPALLVSPRSTFEFAAGMPDEFVLRLQTAVVEGDGDHQLVVRLASADRAEVGQPDSVTAVILDRTPWWKKLLQVVVSLPAWAVALAAVAAVATVSLIFMPRATCSIRGGSVDLGGLPLKKRWPAVRVDTVIGDASYSVPFPLPIGRKSDAEPSSA